MKLFRLAIIIFAASLSLPAHPMGNFSINHYTRIELGQQSEKLVYILDFAEIPTSELFAEWGSSAKTPDGLQTSSARQAVTWAQALLLQSGEQTVPVKWKSVVASTADGAGGMPVLRVVMTADFAAAGELNFHDGNYADRTGWKEIVIRHAESVQVKAATHSARDLSQALTVYPADLTVTPPQDLSASVTWNTQSAAASPKPETPVPGKVTLPAVVVPAAVPEPAPTTAPQASFATQQPEVAGTVSRGDYLSRMLKQKHFGFSTIVLGLLVAFCLGAMHAMSPGHGKTIVAAYLVGSRGTLKHAGILGFTVTFTHTISVFLLGLGVLFFQKYIVPEKVVPILGAISGASIVAIGAYLLYKRTMALADSHEVENKPAHAHAHAHSHAHSHSHSHASAHSHSHGGSIHTHTVPEQITMGSLLGLGISGGLVPCPSALVLLLSAISLGQVAIGLALLSAFSAGLAVVLVMIGVLVLYGKTLLPKSERAANHPLVRLLPVFSSVVVIVVGLLMTLTAVGVIQPVKLLS